MREVAKRLTAIDRRRDKERSGLEFLGRAQELLDALVLRKILFEVEQCLERQVAVIRFLHLGIAKIADVVPAALRALGPLADAERVLDDNGLAVRAGEGRGLQELALAG